MAKRKTAAKPRGRPFQKRDSRKTKVLTLRVSDDLWDALNARAKAAGKPRAQDVTDRLVASLKEQGRRERDEDIFGDVTTKRLVSTLVGQFLFNGINAGRERFGDAVTREQWMRDSYCFDRALESLVLDLWKQRPDKTQEGTVHWFEHLKARIISEWINASEGTTT
jgi:hypothetical protein